MTNTIVWQEIDHFPALETDQLHIWWTELVDDATFLDACMSHLSPEEKARSVRIQHAEARHHFVLGRACARVLLGNFFGIAPHAVPITTSPHGKPETSISGQTIFFNVAHSGGHVLIALCREFPVGIDVECVDTSIHFAEIAQLSFTPTENAKLAAIDDHEQRRFAFYRCWAQKEAVAKAEGSGLSLALASFEVPVSAAQSAPVRLPSSSNAGDQIFYLTDLPLGPGAAAAVASASRDCNLALLKFPHSAIERRNS